MTRPLNDDSPVNSALKDGILIGVVATLRQFAIPVNSANIASVLRSQQGWSEEEITFFLRYALIFNIQK